MIVKKCIVSLWEISFPLTDVFSLLVTLQIFIKWRHYEFRQSHVTFDTNEEATVVKKAGISTFFGLVVSLVHLYGIFLLEDNSKTITYFLLKVLYFVQLPNESYDVAENTHHRGKDHCKADHQFN